MNRALKYLLKKEWSMGNGQCPECGGVPECWFPHPLHAEPESLGHKKYCVLARAIEEAGGKPLYLGKSKLKGKYRFGLSDDSPIYHMIPADEPLSEREKRVLERHAKILDDIFWKAMSKVLMEVKP
jgi:hypothetical protein